MDKKGKIKIGIIFIVLVGILSLCFVLAGSFNPEDTRKIGYEFLNDNKVVHIWNTQDDYFFNVSSGVQFTNHYESFWTRNIFCIGYYSGGEWNKIYCADELNNFNKDIETDNETYVEATLWKDITYGSYDLRLGIQYYLEVNDTKLSVKVYGKNIGIDIPFDLGFAWKVTDVDITYRDKKDTIFINKTDYPLDGVYSITFTNMTNRLDNYSYNNVTNTSTNTYVYEPNSKMRLFDYTEFLSIDWNSNLDYSAKIYGDGNQDNFYFMLMINAGHFNPNQEKSTTMYWIDAFSDYTGLHWDLAASGNAHPYGLTTNDTDIWVSGAITDYIYHYTYNGTLLGSFSVQAEMGTAVTVYGITTNNEYIWANHQGGDEVYKYYMNGTYTGVHFDTSGQITDGTGMANNGSNLFVADTTSKNVFSYLLDGTYIRSFTVSANPGGLAFVNHSLWTTHGANQTISNWSMTGVASGQVTISGDNANLDSMVFYHNMTGDVNYFYMADGSDDEIYIYEGYDFVSGECSPTLNEDWSISDAQVCNGVATTTGTGSIIIVTGGTLHLLNGANITTTKLELRTTGDQVFVSSKSKLVIG